MPVSDIKPCAYNHDTGAIDVIFMDGRKNECLVQQN